MSRAGDLGINTTAGVVTGLRNIATGKKSRVEVLPVVDLITDTAKNKVDDAT